MSSITKSVASSAIGSIEELTPEAKEELMDKIKKIEERIVANVEKYNEQIKAAESEQTALHSLQTKAYLVSERYRKASRTKGTDTADIESELNELDTKIQCALNETLEAKNTALVLLQSLYKEHVEYLSQIANGLKNRCDELQKAQSSSATSGRPDNL
jgi:hypothetical protein